MHARSLARAARAAGPLLFVAWLSTFCLSGCASFLRQPVALQKAEADAFGCGSQSVQQDMSKLFPTVLDALAGGSEDWKAPLDAAKANGWQALGCAISHAIYDALGGLAGIASQEDLERAARRRLAFASMQPGAVPQLTPSQRVLQRGLDYLGALRSERAHPAAAAPGAAPAH